MRFSAQRRAEVRECFVRVTVSVGGGRSPWAPKPGGRPRQADIREVVNAILYLNRTGWSWRILPHEFPPWGTVHYDYRRFRLEGLWPQIHDHLRQQLRQKVGRKLTPEFLQALRFTPDA